MTGIIEEIERYKLWNKEVAQPKVQQFVTDKNEPLAKRFEVWEKYSDKECHPWILNHQKHGILRDIIEQNSDFFEKYQTFDYSFFLEAEEFRKPYSLDDIKEQLIQSNLGSFTYDW